MSSIKVVEHPPPTHVSDPYNAPEAYAYGLVFLTSFLGLQFYFRQKYNIPLKNDEFGPRICSLIHAVLSTFGCLYAFMSHDGGWFTTVETTRVQGIWCMFTFAYMLHDTIIMFLWQFDIVYFVHHLVALSFSFVGAFMGVHGFPSAVSIFLAEIANPLMHLRWLMGALGYRKHRATRIVTISWFVLFGGLRFGYGAFFTHQLSNSGMPAFCWITVGGLVLYSWKFIADALRAEMRGEWWAG